MSNNSLIAQPWCRHCSKALDYLHVNDIISINRRDDKIPVRMNSRKRAGQQAKTIVVTEWGTHKFM